MLEQGVSFRAHHGAGMLCTPARACLYTGQHTAFTRMFDNDNQGWIEPMSANVPTLGTQLKALGYHTAYRGKWHLSHAYPHTGDMTPSSGGAASDEDYTGVLAPFGFDEYQRNGDIIGAAHEGWTHDARIAADAANWLGGASKQLARPWFLAVNFVNPHDIMLFDADGDGPEQPSGGLMQLKGRPDDPLYAKDWDVPLPPTFQQSFADRPQAHDEFRRVCDVVFGAMPRDREDLWRAHASYYVNCLRDVDRHLLTVLDALEASGQRERTIVILTSDHGEMLGAHGCRQKGPFAYRENLRLPLVVWHPDIAAGTRDVVTSQIDLAPSLLELAGVERATIRERWSALRGASFAAAVADGAASTERSAALFSNQALTLIDADWAAGISALREDGVRAGLKAGTLRVDLQKRGFLDGFHDGRYTFARYRSPTNTTPPADAADLYARFDVELYDHTSDPQETTNLATNRVEHEALVWQLSQRLDALMDAELAGAPAFQIPGAMKLRLRGIPRLWRG
jgi:arylsulfatase